MKNSWVVFAFVVAAVVFAFLRAHKPAPDEGNSVVAKVTAEPSMPKSGAKVAAIKAVKPATESTRQIRIARPLALQQDQASLLKNAVRYQIDEGLVVVQGDAVVGAPADPNAPAQGLVTMPTVQLWKTKEIPVFVQANVSHPERVRQALELFNDSAIHFVPYTDQDDVIVFEEGTGICKSYVGSVGGKQPIWLAPDCGPSEIAHEIMHALGFVHEQNRSDRDNFIEVYNDNIEEQFRYNFDKLPEDTMKVSGLSDFDYESIMMYPTSMFAKPGQQTMRSKTSAQILPSQGLSSKDRERLQRAYGGF